VSGLAEFVHKFMWLKWCGLCSLAGMDRQRSQGLDGSQGRLQVSPEPEVMSPPSSPRLRHSTFGATLDFIEALCDASSGLTAFAAVSGLRSRRGYA